MLILCVIAGATLGEASAQAIDKLRNLGIHYMPTLKALQLTNHWQRQQDLLKNEKALDPYTPSILPTKGQKLDEQLRNTAEAVRRIAEYVRMVIAQNKAWDVALKQHWADAKREEIDEADEERQYYDHLSKISDIAHDQVQPYVKAAQERQKGDAQAKRDSMMAQEATARHALLAHQQTERQNMLGRFETGKAQAARRALENMILDLNIKSFADENAWNRKQAELHDQLLQLTKGNVDSPWYQDRVQDINDFDAYWHTMKMTDSANYQTIVEIMRQIAVGQDWLQDRNKADITDMWNTLSVRQLKTLYAECNALRARYADEDSITKLKHNASTMYEWCDAYLMDKLNIVRLGKERELQAQYPDQRWVVFIDDDKNLRVFTDVETGGATNNLCLFAAVLKQAQGYPLAQRMWEDRNNNTLFENHLHDAAFLLALDAMVPGIESIQKNPLALKAFLNFPAKYGQTKLDEVIRDEHLCDFRAILFNKIYENLNKEYALYDPKCHDHKQVASVRKIVSGIISGARGHYQKFETFLTEQRFAKDADGQYLDDKVIALFLIYLNATHAQLDNDFAMLMALLYDHKPINVLTYNGDHVVHFKTLDLLPAAMLHQEPLWVMQEGGEWGGHYTSLIPQPPHDMRFES